MAKLLVACVLMVMVSESQALGASPRSTMVERDQAELEDVYIRLYRFRLERRQLLIEQQREELAHLLAKRQRREALYESNAASAEELEESRRDAEVAALRLEEYEAQAREAEIMLEIAIDRITLGLEMPICVELQ